VSGKRARALRKAQDRMEPTFKAVNAFLDDKRSIRMRSFHGLLKEISDLESCHGDSSKNTDRIHVLAELSDFLFKGLEEDGKFMWEVFHVLYSRIGNDKADELGRDWCLEATPTETVEGAAERRQYLKENPDEQVY